MANLYQIQGRDAQLALTEFSTLFDAALAASDAEQWANTIGTANNSSAVKTTYPISVSAAGYVLRTGDDRARDLFERSLSMSIVEWQDAVKIQLLRLVDPNFVGWGSEPARIATEALRHPNTLVAEMLKANPLLDFYREEREKSQTASTIRLFANNHPVNVFDASQGTFDNDHTVTALDGDFIAATRQRFRAKKAANGKVMGLRFNGLMVPAALEETARKLLESDMLLEAVTNKAGTENVGAIANNNRFKGTVTLIVCDELLDDNVMYPLDLRHPARPWIVQTGGTPEERRLDASSEYCTQTGFVQIKYVLKQAVAAALPHAIERVTISP